MDSDVIFFPIQVIMSQALRRYSRRNLACWKPGIQVLIWKITLKLKNLEKMFGIFIMKVNPCQLQTNIGLKMRIL